MQRQRKPRIDLIGYENDNVVVMRTEKPSRWVVHCKKCGQEHEQTSREIKRGCVPRTCDQFKPHNWSGLDREDAIMRRKYGISLADFYDLLGFQNNKCAVCEKPISALSRRMNVDHCHKTGVVRGLLCTGCNTGIGYFGDDVDGMNKAIKYLENTPFSRMRKHYARAR